MGPPSRSAPRRGPADGLRRGSDSEDDRAQRRGRPELGEGSYWEQVGVRNWWLTEIGSRLNDQRTRLHDSVRDRADPLPPNDVITVRVVVCLERDSVVGVVHVVMMEDDGKRAVRRQERNVMLALGHRDQAEDV